MTFVGLCRGDCSLGQHQCRRYPSKRTSIDRAEKSASRHFWTKYIAEKQQHHHVVGAFGTCRLGLSILRLKVSAFGE
jgi:hypothetical protein